MWFRYISLALQYAPIIVMLIHTIESMASPEVTGVEKEALFLETFREVLFSFGVVMNDDMIKLIKSLTTSLVVLYNLLGRFRSSEESVGDMTSKEVQSAILHSVEKRSDDIAKAIEPLEPELKAGLEQLLADKERVEAHVPQ